MSNRKSDYPIWKFFEKCGSCVSKIASCNYCSREISYKTSITNLKTHLKSRHVSAFSEFLSLNKSFGSTDAQENNSATLISKDELGSDDSWPTEYLENVPNSPIMIQVNENSKSPIPKSASKRKSFDIQSSPIKSENTEKRPKQEKNEDDIDDFGKYVASSLRILNKKNMIHAQDEIQSILSKYKLRELHRK